MAGPRIMRPRGGGRLSRGFGSAPMGQSIHPASSSAAFNPWSASYPVPLHAVWADDPDWSNPGDGNAVSSWRNESGGGDPAQGTGTAQPTYRASTAAFNNRATVQFDGGDWLRVAFSTGALTQPYHVVVIGNLTGDGQTLVNGDDLTHRSLVGSSGTTWAMLAGTLITGGTIDSDPHVLVATYNGASSTFDVDGTETITGNSGAEVLDGWTVGANPAASPTSFLTGHIAYVGIYAGAADLSGLVTALADYYGIAVA